MKRILVWLLSFSAVASQAQVNTIKKTSVAIPVATPVIAAADTKVAFLANATYVGGQELTNTSNTKVIFGGTVFDEGKNFSIPEGCFVVPVDGIYHFDVRVSWLKFSAPGSVTINLNTSDFTFMATDVLVPSTTNAVFDHNFGSLLKLKAGQKVYVYLKQNSTAIQRYQQVQLSGFKVN